jgi:hypothetical protein
MYQVILQRILRMKMGRKGTELTHHESLHLNPFGFHVGGMYAIITDQRIGHGDDLAVIGGIGKDFLIPGHGGVENNLALGDSLHAEGIPFKDPPVF